MLEPGAAKVLVIFIAKGFQVDIGGIQIWADHLQRFGGHIAVSDKYIAQATFMGQAGRLIGKFEKNCGLGIGVGNAPATPLLGCRDDFPGGDLAAHNGPLMIGGHLGNIGILTEPAAKIAAHRGDGIRKGVGKKMKQRLFFNGINVPGNQFAVYQGFQGTLAVFTHRANTPATIFNNAAVAAKVAFDLVVLLRLPKIGFHDHSNGQVGQFARSPVRRIVAFCINESRLKF